MLENLRNIRSSVLQIFRKPSGVASRTPSRRRVKRGSSFTDSQGRNLPDPWARPKWSAGRNVANLPAVIGGTLIDGGPTKTLLGQSRLLQVNPDAFRRPRQFRSLSEYASQVTDFHESEVIAMDMTSRGSGGRPRARHLTKSERLSRVGPSDTHTAALDSTRKLPRGDSAVLRGQDEEEIARTVLGYILDYFFGGA